LLGGLSKKKHPGVYLSPYASCPEKV